MGYASIMVYVEDVDSADSRIVLACDLAKLFGARLSGVSASAPTPSIVQPYPGMAMLGHAWIREQQIAEQEVQRAEERFRSVGGVRFPELTWRGGLRDPAQFVASQARIADLIVLGPKSTLALSMQRGESRRCLDGGGATGFGHAAQFHPEADACSCPRRLEGLPSSLAALLPMRCPCSAEPRRSP